MKYRIDESPCGIQLDIWDWMLMKERETLKKENKNERNYQGNGKNGSCINEMQACGKGRPCDRKEKA